MGEQKISKIHSIVSRYVNQYLGSTFIDYYELFEIDKNKSCEEIALDLKKLEVLFHPDLELYLPEFMREYYVEVVEEFLNCKRVFSSPSVRSYYDQQQSKTNKEQETDSQNSEDISEDELNKVIYALELTIKAHGLVFTTNNVKLIIENQVANSWEQGFSKGSRKGLTELGEEKFKKIIRKFAPNSNNSEEIIFECFTYLYQYQNELKELMFPFENACTKTLEKYNAAQVKAAIGDFINSNRAKKFTNTDNSRELLLSKINPRDIIPFIKIYLNSFKKEDEAYKYQNLKLYDEDILIEIFVNKFSFEYKKKTMK